MNIIILSGSARKKSHTLGLANAIADQIGAGIEVIDLVDLDLPNIDPQFHRDPLAHPDETVANFAKKVDEADAIVLLSPVYHNSYSGILKNALDHLAISQFKGKPVALGSNGGDRTSQVVDHLRIVSRGLSAIAIPTQVCTSDADYVETSDGFKLENPKIKSRIERLVNELLEITKKLS